MKRIAFPAVFVVFITLAFLAGTAEAQRRDHLTAEEIELVRDVQDVDLRMGLFVHAIERRLWVISGTDALTPEQKKRVEKDHGEWGDLPTGTRTELISDIERILSEAIDKLEDVFDREPEQELIPFALYVIADYSEILIPELRSLAESTEDRRQLGLLESAVIHCQSILDAREGIPRPTGKRKKKKQAS
ncbi:MAG: hypothetical protein OEQ28_00735 [Acidobacteriota bacterium]|nr:hypothetical protein [Acidobacteriota bacterium]